jgi:hypothetical protein
MGIARPLPKIPIRRCLLKPPLRTKSVGTKVSEAEFALLEERARGAGLRLAEWVREALLAAPVEPGMGSGVDSGEVALAEILALRSLLLNLHFRAAKGEPVAESEMRGLIERADGSKIERARERMEAVRTAARATGPEAETASETAADTNPEEE